MPALEQIGEWDTTQLTKFVNQILQDSDFLTAAKKVYDEVVVTRKLELQDEIKLDQAQTSVGAAGGATALPATPLGYFKVLDALGVVRVIPYYNAS